MINYLYWIEKQKSLVTLQEEPLTGFTLKAGHNRVKDPLFLVIVSIRNKTAENTLLETLRITFIDNDGKFRPRTWQYFLIIKTAALRKKPSNWSFWFGGIVLLLCMYHSSRMIGCFIYHRYQAHNRE